MSADSCGGGNILIPPSVPARKLGDYLRVAIGLHFFLAIFIMIAGRYFDGVFDLLGVLIGYMSIKNREGYSFSCVLSYCVFTGMDVFWAVLRGILFFAGVSSTSTGSESGGGIYWVAVIGYIIGPFIYLFACVTAYYLYKELKRLVEESNGAAGGEEQGGGAAYAASAPAQQSGGSAGGQGWVHQESHPSSSTSSFKPFTGTGNRLGGS